MSALVTALMDSLVQEASVTNVAASARSVMAPPPNVPRAIVNMTLYTVKRFGRPGVSAVLINAYLGNIRAMK